MDDQKKVLQEDEIDLIELVRVIWSKKWFITKITFGFTALGLLIAFTSPKEYKTSCTLIPEAMGNEGKLGGSLGGLASLAGIDLGGMTGGSSTINPGLYRTIASSTPFMVSLMESEFYFEERGDSMALFSYFKDHYKTTLIGKILNIPRNILSWVKPTEIKIATSNDINLIILSNVESNIIEALRDRIKVTMDWELGIVIIDVEMQDPIVTAQIAEFTRKYITSVVQDYSLSKGKDQLLFVEKQLLDKVVDFEKAQLKLAKFRDANRNVTTSQAKTEEEKLQSEYNIAFNVYNQLAQQRETVKLQLNQNKAIFSVLEPVKVPVEKSSPRRGLILTGFLLFGVFSGVISCLVKNWYINFSSKEL